MGGLYLLRIGEGRGEMIDDAGARALAGAIDRVSPRGDEGRAQVLMKMRAAVRYGLSVIAIVPAVTGMTSTDSPSSVDTSPSSSTIWCFFSNG